MPSHIVLFTAALAWLALPLAAQCSTVWSSGGPQPQLSGFGTCSTQWDPDGTGPAVPRLVVGGSILRGGSQPIDQLVMTWDGSAWAELGPGPGTNPIGTAGVVALTVWNGLLVAGGSFTGGGMDHVALWTGAAWQGLGAGFPITVQQLTVWNGNLVAISQTSGTPVIQTWNGVTWTSLPLPPNLMFPQAAISYQGLLCVAGVENTPTQGVLERWNGSAWLPSIFAQQTINCLAVRPTSAFGGSDTLYAAGRFTSIGGTTASRIAANTRARSGSARAIASVTAASKSAGNPAVRSSESSDMRPRTVSPGAVMPAAAAAVGCRGERRTPGSARPRIHRHGRVWVSFQRATATPARTLACSH